MARPQLFPRSAYVMKALGRVEDAVIANAFGVSSKTIQGFRQQEGVPSFRSGLVPRAKSQEGYFLSLEIDGVKTSIYFPLEEHVQLASVLGGPDEVNRLARQIARQYKSTSEVSRSQYVRERLARRAERLKTDN